MSWDDLLDLVATILVVWGVVAVLVGLAVGKFCKAGQGPDEQLAEPVCRDEESSPKG